MQPDTTLPKEPKVKIYTASLTSSASTNPDPSAIISANIYQNTLGFTPTFVRDGTGEYYIVGDFGENVWFTFQSPGSYNSGVEMVLAEHLINEAGYPPNIIYFVTKDNTHTLYDIWESAIQVEIKLY